MTATVVLLGGRDRLTRAVYNHLATTLPAGVHLMALLEAHPSRIDLARGRARRLGWPVVAGHIGFAVLVMPVLSRMGRNRARELARLHGLDFSPIPDPVLVRSVNDPDAVSLLQQLDPAVVVVHGTRILRPSTLESVEGPFVNLHAGITPRYRGVHGGYWARAEGETALMGSTVHLVDRGVDTGGILGQRTFQPSARDTIATYPFLHLAAGLPVLSATVSDLLLGIPPTVVNPLAGAEQSRLRHHPTAWRYLAGRARGIR